MKSFMKYVVYGAAITLGGLVITKTATVITSPYKRAVLKQKIKKAKSNAKNIFKKRKEA